MMHRRSFFAALAAGVAATTLAAAAQAAPLADMVTASVAPEAAAALPGVGEPVEMRRRAHRRVRRVVRRPRRRARRVIRRARRRS
ncbi:MAG: hypothetical protein Q8O26_18815 [Phreatobacter sp.]|uniref:hypothetical protein n=1 Tax=Phreatobacter sp. TaxID=1966341 RepID=UPI002732CE0F|nr:hypothetical protein [Phreatobacter sp.]MDP2803930.1 hypothetical protein [Phreatobacter sp.]